VVRWCRERWQAKRTTPLTYGTAGFRVSDVAYAGSILVFADVTMQWPVATFDEVTAESFAPVLARGDISILLLGCGRRMAQVPAELRRALRAGGIVLDPMDTGAACRTCNILLAEERRVAAALIKLI
jgi:uncharacterized protein